MESAQVKKNPLASYFRQPKIYIKLPSGGKFYPPGSLDVSETGEYAVYAMTAKDELMFKTPDALMNGQATIEVIKSCIPAIVDPWKMPSIDIDAVLIAIRIASYGENMDIGTACPNCNHYNDYSMNLIRYLDTFNDFQYVDQIPVPPLTVYIRPYNYRELTKTAFRALEQQKIFNVVNDEEMDDDIKIEKFGESFVKLTKLTIDIIVGCVDRIESPEGTVNDMEQIKEFIENAPSEVFQKINDHIVNMKNKIEMKAESVVCQECSHGFTVNITMDQANFFAVRP
jgi:hypothetical protein